MQMLGSFVTCFKRNWTLGLAFIASATYFFWGYSLKTHQQIPSFTLKSSYMQKDENSSFLSAIQIYTCTYNIAISKVYCWMAKKKNLSLLFSLKKKKSLLFKN